MTKMADSEGEKKLPCAQRFLKSLFGDFDDDIVEKVLWYPQYYSSYLLHCISFHF